MTQYTCKRCGDEAIIDSSEVDANTVNEEIWTHFYENHRNDLRATNIFSAYLSKE